MTRVTTDDRRAVLVVHTRPVTGREAEFDRWYTETHLPQVVALEGFVSARRYRLSPTPGAVNEHSLPYLAVYDVEPGGLERARATLVAALQSSQLARLEGGTPLLDSSEALHDERVVGWFEEIASAPRTR